MVPLRRPNDGEMKGISRAFHTRAQGTDPAESSRARAEADYQTRDWTFRAGAQSRRDGVIVAWHEVPGKAAAQKNRPVGYGMRARRPGPRAISLKMCVVFLKGRLITPIL